ncbi:Oidioi.mRNA.OKI2018_I69.PAR.g10809.t1.cds [Oikopleura dioica]|uniref:Ubiquitin thioesterase OTU n=1 Tax=Oikopleura dioica TaxID=34765 RepID=A0ABN7RSK1_OIKDI|nr:Oidioi.mRNA.OKI2018_I69.PAR.g10809.t1.cds [Oikopleura dioica]
MSEEGDFNPETQIVIKSISLLLEELDDRHAKETKYYEDIFQKRISEAVNKKRIKKEVKKERDDLDDRHEKEKSRLLFSENDEIILAKLSLEEKESIADSKGEESEKSEETNAQVEKESKLSKTAKRRLKKEQEEKERKERIKAAIDEENEKFLRGELTPAAVEKERLNNLLKQNGLKRKSVPSDGDCMFSSLVHQMKKNRPRISVEELREIAAEHLLKNKEQFAAFLESDIELYCQKLVNEPIWGGQIELTALAAALETRIRVIQAESPNELFFGEEKNDEEKLLTIIYCRHLYASGEHYDSVEAI